VKPRESDNGSHLQVPGKRIVTNPQDAHIFVRRMGSTHVQPFQGQDRNMPSQEKQAGGFGKF